MHLKNPPIPPAPSAPLKLLYRLTEGDAFFLRVRGLPHLLDSPSVMLQFLHFKRERLTLFSQTTCVHVSGSLGEDKQTVRTLTGVVPANIADGMYLLSGVSVRAGNLTGRMISAHLGDALMPLEPRQGFCVGSMHCDLGYVDETFQFLGMELM